MNQQEKVWLENNIHNHTWVQLTELYNKVYKTNYTIAAIRHKCNRNGITKTKADRFKLRCFYTLEQKEWLVKNSNLLRKELTVLFNKTFNTNKTTAQIKQQIQMISKQLNVDTTYKYSIDIALADKELLDYIYQNYKKYHREMFIKKCMEFSNNKYTQCVIEHLFRRLKLKGFKKEPRLWTKEMIKTFEENMNKSDEEISTILSQKYHKSITTHAVSHYRIRHYGHKEFRYTPNGEPRLSIYPIGYQMLESRKKVVYEKVDKDTWKVKKRIMYEKYHNEKLKSNEYIIQLDGNPFNFNKDNLCKVSKKEHLNLIGYDYEGKGKLTEAALELFKTQELIKQMEK